MLELTKESDRHEFAATPKADGKRLDVYLATRFRDYSRTLLQKFCNEGRVRVGGEIAKPSRKLDLGERIEIFLPRIKTFKPEPEALPVSIIFEDEYLVIVDKEAGMIVHPARGHMTGTLVNALLHHTGVDMPDAGDDVPRPGVVHRLDRFTSGVMVLAKRHGAYENLAQQFEFRTTKKEYLALVEGEMEFDSSYIEEPIGRSPSHRERMAIRNDGTGKESSTYYEVIERFRGYTYVRCHPRTGRTHQIRVHLAHIGHPIMADDTYGAAAPVMIEQLAGVPPAPVSEDEIATPPLLSRQALHAHRLEIQHPGTGERMSFEAPLAADLVATLAALRAHRARPKKRAGP